MVALKKRMRSSHVLLAAAAGYLLPATMAQSNGSVTGTDLAFGPINFAGYNNYVYRDNVTAVQAVISSNPSNPGQSRSRFILAFPKGNSGVAIYFAPLNGTLATTLDNTTFASISAPDNQTGFKGQMNLSADAALDKALIGSVRTLRDYVEGNGTEHSIFNYTLGQYNSSSVTLVRNWINGSTVQYFTMSAVDNFNISVTPNPNATLPPDVVLNRPDQARNGTLEFSCTFNFTNTTETLIGLGGTQLFLPASAAGSANNSALLSSTLTAINGPGAAIANQTAFLSYTDVFFAGGWRFLTYFGRDTLLSLRLLLPTLTQEASEGIMRAVIERIRTDGETGEICHEETVGDYASFINIQNNQSYLGDQPSYNYVMVDSDFLLLPVMSDYFLSSPQGQGRAEAFLNQTSALQPGTLRSLLMLNVDHVMNLTMPFANNQTYENLVRIRDANVGNWRDSNTGLGGGKFAFDINTAFVPACLRAIASLAGAGILPSNYSSAAASAEIWETAAPSFFQVPIDAATAQSRLNNYIQQANLTNATVTGAGSLNSTATPSAGFGNATQLIGGMQGQNSTFYALSLKEDGTPVEVLHSDLGFLLEYGNNVSASVIQAVVEAMQPYPAGLLTNVGMVVANAAYDSNTTDIATFDYRQYHGAVSWSWQQGMMAKGIARQLALAGVANNTSLDPPPANATVPAWASDSGLVSSLQQAQTRLWDSIQGSASVLYTEVWSPVYDAGSNAFTIGDLGALSPTGTEGDAVQLWSYGFLGLVDPRTGKPVAEGF